MLHIFKASRKAVQFPHHDKLHPQSEKEQGKKNEDNLALW